MERSEYRTGGRGHHDDLASTLSQALGSMALGVLLIAFLPAIFRTEFRKIHFVSPIGRVVLLTDTAVSDARMETYFNCSDKRELVAVLNPSPRAPVPFDASSDVTIRVAFEAATQVPWHIYVIPRESGSLDADHNDFHEVDTSDVGGGRVWQSDGVWTPGREAGADESTITTLVPGQNGTRLSTNGCPIQDDGNAIDLEVPRPDMGSDLISMRDRGLSSGRHAHWVLGSAPSTIEWTIGFESSYEPRNQLGPEYDAKGRVWRGITTKDHSPLSLNETISDGTEEAVAAHNDFVAGLAYGIGGSTIAGGLVLLLGLAPRLRRRDRAE
jgi:hypothetical protein